MVASYSVNRLVKEFLSLAEKGQGGWWHGGWPACPYTVSKIAVNSYTRWDDGIVAMLLVAT